MLGLLGPLDAGLSFGECSYKLGDTISLAVTLSTRRDCEVREGRVELVSDARYRDVFPSFKLEGGPFGVSSFSIGDEVTRPVAPVVACAVVFLTDTRLHSGATRGYDVELQIPREPTTPQAVEASKGLPPADGASEVPRRPAMRSWWLQAVVDVVRAPDVTLREAVEVVSA